MQLVQEGVAFHAHTSQNSCSILFWKAVLLAVRQPSPKHRFLIPVHLRLQDYFSSFLPLTDEV